MFTHCFAKEVQNISQSRRNAWHNLLEIEDVYCNRAISTFQLMHTCLTQGCYNLMKK